MVTTRRSTRIRRLAIVAGATLLPLVALEAGARFALDGKPPEALITAPLDSAPNLHKDRVFRFDPDLFWRVRPGLDIDALPWADRTTPRGFRGVDDVTESRTLSQVVALGDSCTYGFGVPFDASWPAQLAAGGGLEVVNAGVPGYSTYQGGLWWTEIAARTAPDVLVLEFGNNDAAAWPTWRGDGVVFLTDAERARHVRALEVWRMSAFLGWLLARRVDASSAPQNLTDAEIFSGAPRVPVGEFEVRLNSLANAAPSVVLLRWARRRELDPEWRSDPSPESRDADYAAAIRRVAAQGHVLVDVGTEFRASGLAPDELYVDDVHASQVGNAIVAAAVRRELAQRLRPH